MKKRTFVYSSIKKFFVHFSVFILIFIILNFLIALTWSPIKDLFFKNVSKKEYFSEEVLKSIGIAKENEIEFYEEMWINRTFKYNQFTEYSEGEKVDQKYVNLNEKNGRKIENNSNCNINIFFYGGSNTFGYNVADNKTIPAYFKKLLNDNLKHNYCVYNFGSASFYSLRENSILIKHILEDKNKKNDYSIFLNGMNERVGSDGITLHLIKLFEGINLGLLNRLKFSTQNFIYSLPIVKLYKKIEYMRLNNNNENFQKDLDIIKAKNLDLQLLKNNFKKNLKIRKGICDSMELRCYTFIQPFPIIHGKIPNQLDIYKQEGGLITDNKTVEGYYTKLHLLFSNLEGVLDISNALNDISELSFVDGSHFSPIANEAVAQMMYKKIFSGFNK